MSDEDSAAEGRGDDHPRGPGPSDFEDRFWLLTLSLIVVVIFLIGLIGADTGPANQDGYTGWH